MEHINAVISENLRALRAQQKMSLDALAKLSGVSKSMLGQIERGEVNPTISTLWKIAHGLKISFSELMSRPEKDLETVPYSMLEALNEDEGHFRTHMVFTFDSTRRFEMLLIEADAGARVIAEPHTNGAQEFITVTSGEVCIALQGQELHLKAGDSIRFKADCPHSYQVSNEEMCRMNMVIYYPPAQ